MKTIELSKNTCERCAIPFPTHIYAYHHPFNIMFEGII